MIRLVPPTKIELRPTETMGMGVFATQLIKMGEVLEDCHLIDLPTGDGLEVLPDFRFNYPARQDDWEYLVVPTGMGMVYNHSDMPNVIWNDHPTIQYVFRFIAIRDIQMGEQCFIHYGNAQYP
jgi:hypothetical protein